MPANWMDHAIASVAPRMAARRVLARQAFETLTRGYDGASKGRRTEGWRAPGSSADTEIGVAGALLRDRMRDLVRNNPHAAKAVAVLVNNIVGAGIMPRAASGDEALDRKVDALFERWTADCDADGQLDFYGLQTLICREMVEAGEVLVRRRLRRASGARLLSGCISISFSHSAVASAVRLSRASLAARRSLSRSEPWLRRWYSVVICCVSR